MRLSAIFSLKCNWCISLLRHFSTFIELNTTNAFHHYCICATLISTSISHILQLGIVHKLCCVLSRNLKLEQLLFSLRELLKTLYFILRLFFLEFLEIGLVQMFFNIFLNTRFIVVFNDVFYVKTYLSFSMLR